MARVGASSTRPGPGVRGNRLGRWRRRRVRTGRPIPPARSPPAGGARPGRVGPSSGDVGRPPGARRGRAGRLGPDPFGQLPEPGLEAAAWVEQVHGVGQLGGALGDDLGVEVAALPRGVLKDEPAATEVQRHALGLRLRGRAGRRPGWRSGRVGTHPQGADVGGADEEPGPGQDGPDPVGVAIEGVGVVVTVAPPGPDDRPGPVLGAAAGPDVRVEVLAAGGAGGDRRPGDAPAPPGSPARDWPVSPVMRTKGARPSRAPRQASASGPERQRAPGRRRQAVDPVAASVGERPAVASPAKAADRPPTARSRCACGEDGSTQASRPRAGSGTSSRTTPRRVVTGEVLVRAERQPHRPDLEQDLRGIGVLPRLGDDRAADDRLGAAGDDEAVQASRAGPAHPVQQPLLERAQQALIRSGSVVGRTLTQIRATSGDGQAVRGGAKRSQDVVTQRGGGPGVAGHTALAAAGKGRSGSGRARDPVDRQAGGDAGGLAEGRRRPGRSRARCSAGS